MLNITCSVSVSRCRSSPERRLHLLFGVSAGGLGLDVDVQKFVSYVNLSIPRAIFFPRLNSCLSRRALARSISPSSNNRRSRRQLLDEYLPDGTPMTGVYRSFCSTYPRHHARRHFPRLPCVCASPSRRRELPSQTT